MTSFVFRMLAKVMFGSGVAKQAGEECKKLGAKKVFFVTDPVMWKLPAFSVVSGSLEAAGLEVLVFSEVEADPSIETVDKAASLMKTFGGDMVIALGGGSSMDCAKATALLQTNDGSIKDYLYRVRSVTHPAKPIICIPTTAGTGSEVTPTSVTTDKEKPKKIGVADDSQMPKIALVDPDLHIGMPPALMSATGMDALCHTIESYTSLGTEPITDGLCLHAIRLIADNLTKAVANGRDPEVRSNMVLASLIAGITLTNAGLGLVHGIAHPLGAMYQIPHGVANALMLPYVMKFNALAAPERFRDIAIALGENVHGFSKNDAALKAVAAVRRIAADVGVPLTLKEAGISRKDIPFIVKSSMGFGLMHLNPRTVTERDIEGILEAALGEGAEAAHA